MQYAKAPYGNAGQREEKEKDAKASGADHEIEDKCPGAPVGARDGEGRKHESDERAKKKA